MQNNVPSYETGHFNILAKVVKMSWILAHLLKSIFKKLVNKNWISD